MNPRLLTLAAAMAVCSMTAVSQQRSTPQNFTGAAETGLVGIKLFDTGKRVIALYGSPNVIEALSIGGGGIGPTGGGGEGGRGGPAGAGGPTAGGAQRPSFDINTPTGPDGFIGDPFGDGSEWRQQAPFSPAGAGEAGARGGGQAAGQAGGGGQTGGLDPGAGLTGSGALVTFTRWVYDRGPSRYAFVLDKFNRVVQIEAVGSIDSRPKTRRGICFNKTFGQIINAYNAPDGYEINGDTVVVRYLVRGRVAFRLQRLEDRKPHRVTGIVVAAGA